MGALGVIAVSVYGRAGSLIGEGVALLAGAVIFFWAQKGTSGSSDHETGVARPFWANLAGSFRLFALTLTGASVGVSLAMFALMEISRAQHPTGVPLVPGAIFLLGCGLAVVGSVLVVVNAMYFRRTGRRF